MIPLSDPGGDRLDLQSCRLWSLWDMINFWLGPFVTAIYMLESELHRARVASAATAHAPVQPEDRRRIQGNVSYISGQCAALRLMGPQGALVELDNMQRGRYTYSDLASRLDHLSSEIRRDITQQAFFHYPPEAAARRQSVDRDWTTVFAAFPSIRNEVVAGLDCWAFDDLTGCVFHMMRAAETGLRALARERGIKKIRRRTPIEYATWGEVVRAIETESQKIKNSMAPGTAKDRALTFYDTVASDLRALLSRYRNKTMHLRDKYDSGEAESAMLRTKSLMEELSRYLDEGQSRKILWSRRP